MAFVVWVKTLKPTAAPPLKPPRSFPIPTKRNQKAWELDAEADDNDEAGDETTAAPSEAFLSLQKDLEEKERIQKENEERMKNEHVKAAEAEKSLRRKVRFGPQGGA